MPNSDSATGPFLLSQHVGLLYHSWCGTINAMETANTVIPQPKKIDPVEVEIIMGTEYPDHLWREAAATIDEAEAEVIKARAIKRHADAAYEAAMAQRDAVQVPRDQMIATDRRVPGRVSLLVGIGRARCAMIRAKMLSRMDQTQETTA